MISPTFESLCRDASDPVLLTQAGGTILWANGAAERLFGGPIAQTPLERLAGAAFARAVTDVRHYSSTDVEITSPTFGAIRQTAVVVDLGAGDPDRPLTLITLKSAVAEGPAVHEREEWLTSVAHDLKNPLGAIFGYADTLLDTPTGASLTPQQREIISRMRGTAARATELVRNYQHLSQLASHAVTTVSGSTDLNGLVTDVVNSTWREDPVHPKVVLELSPLRPVVSIDRLYVERIFANLFTNALKFSRPEAPVTVRTDCDESRVTLAVSNIGEPITPEQAQQLFRPFSRLPSARSVPGTGLGLAIVKAIVTAAGGSVTVEHTPERGNTFTVKLPKPVQ